MAIAGQTLDQAQASEHFLEYYSFLIFVVAVSGPFSFWRTRTSQKNQNWREVTMCNYVTIFLVVLCSLSIVGASSGYQTVTDKEVNTSVVNSLRWFVHNAQPGSRSSNGFKLELRPTGEVACRKVGRY